MHKRKFNRFIAFILTVQFILSLTITATAKTYITDSNKANGSNYTDNTALAAKLNSVFSGNIGLYSNSKCTQSVSAPVGCRKMTGSNQYWIKSNTTGSINSGWQCYIYADAVYNTLFNEWVGKGTSLSHSKKVMHGGRNSVSYDSFKNSGVKTGAIMRTTANSDGSWNSSKAHSLIILSYNSSTITYLEGNGDGKGLVRIATLSWNEFNAGQLSGRSRYVCFIIQPTDDYYEKLYPSTEITPQISFSKSSISLGLNSNTSTTITATIDGAWSSAGWTTSSVYDVYKQSQDGNKITFNISAKSAGNSNFTLTSYDSNGNSLASASINISVSGATLSASASSVNLNLNGTNTSTITLTASGNLPSNYYISYGTSNGNCSLSCGEWSGNSIPFTVTGKSSGSDTLTFSLKNSANNSVIATKTVSVSIDATTYTVAYNANGGSNAPSSQTKTYGKDLTLSSAVPTGKTYTVTFNGNGGTVATSSKQFTQNFSGWNTKSDGSGSSYNKGAVYSSNASTTLYAQWIDPMFSVKNPTRSNYYFLGWYDSNKTEYGKPIGNKYTYDTPITQDLTLYAMWTTNLDLTVFFGDYDLNGEIDFIHDVTAVNNISLNRIKYTDEDLFRCDVNADGIISNDDVTLLNDVRTGKSQMYTMPAYLYFSNISVKQNPYKTVYEYGEEFDCSGLILQANYTNGTKHTMSNGYVITGYDPYKIGEQKLTVNYYFTTTYLTVTVKAPQYNVYYDANGGTVSSVGKSVTYNSAIGTLPTPTREGYTFLGWSYTKNSSSYITSSTVYSYMENKTVYANWQANTYTVTYNTNGGVGTPASDTVTYPNSYTVNATTLPTKQGYTFLGWSTDSSASQPTYLPGATASITSNTVLYAVWQASDMLIEEDELHNSISFANQERVVKFIPVNSGVYSIYSHGEIPLIATLSQGTNIKTETDTSGNFKITATLIKGNAYYITVKSNSTGHFSLFADWIPRECEVSMYDTINNESDVIIVLEGEDLILPIPQKDGYIFDGWYTSASGGSKIGSSITVTENIKIYSHWIKSVLLGDVNGDGTPDSADYAMIKAYATGNVVFDDVQKIVADLNRDGAVDAYDAIYLDLYLNGYLDTL
ncbi:MAG: InlB B-repeat-containing protein [Candidatus Fimenecus sp.]